MILEETGKEIILTILMGYLTTLKHLKMQN